MACSQRCADVSRWWMSQRVMVRMWSSHTQVRLSVPSPGVGSPLPRSLLHPACDGRRLAGSSCSSGWVLTG